MSVPLPLTSTLAPDATVAARQDLFEAAWLARRPGAPLPQWAEFMPPADDSSARDLAFRLIQADIEFRVKAGVPALLAEPYFQHPCLQGDPPFIRARQVELIRWEYQQRWQWGERAQRNAYIERFPEHAAALQDLKPRWNCPYCMRIAIPLDEEEASAAACPYCHETHLVSSLFPAPPAPSAAQPPAASRGLDLRDYELLEQLGRGGMGEVYRSRDPGLGRDLALKILRPDFQGYREAEQRFEQEARITGSLQHPGVVPVHNLGRLPDGRLYFTMKVVRGQTFGAILRQPGPRTPEQRMIDLGIFEKVCQTLAYAHSKGVIHRDLKPANIMVGAFGEVQVMDWGLAKVLSAEKRPADTAATVAESITVQTLWSEATALQSRPGDVLGTCAYMSPEQAGGAIEQLDERCDVFGLGAVLCEVLTGQPPYSGPTGPVVLDRARRGDLATAWERLDQCGAEPELIALAKRCLAVEPAARPRHAGEVTDAVGGYLAGVQQRLREAERQRAVAEARAVEEGKRRRLTVMLAATVLLLLLAGGSWAWMLQQQRAAALARQNETHLALERGRGLLQEGWKTFDIARLKEARAEADAAMKIAPSAAAAAFREEVEERLARAEKDRALLTALLEAWAPKETGAYDRDPLGWMKALTQPSLDEQYVAAFRRWGLDVDQTAEAEVVARLRDEPESVVQEIIAGLAGWMLERRRENRSEMQWRRLLEVADQLDGSGTRRQLLALLTGAPRPRDEIVAGLTGVLLPWTGVCALERGKHWRSLLQLRHQIDVATEPVGSVVLLAQACSAAGDVAGAEELLRRAVAARPDQVVLLHARGKLLERQGRFAEAVVCYQAARGVQPGLGVALGFALSRAGRVEESRDVLHDLIRRQPNNPELYYDLGRALPYPRIDEAAAAFRKCVALNPNFAYGHRALAGLLAMHWKMDEAEPACRRAIALKPDFAVAHCLLGYILHAQKKWDAAVEAYRQAVAVQPDFALAYSLLGFTLLEQKKVDEAVTAFRRAIALQPDFVEAHCALGFALLGQQKPAEAEVAFRQAIALRPTFVEPYLNLGVALAGQEKLPEAEAVFRQAIVLAPNWIEAHSNLGEILLRQFKLKEAVAVFRKADQLRPNDPVLRDNLLRAEKRLKDVIDLDRAWRRLWSRPKGSPKRD